MTAYPGLAQDALQLWHMAAVGVKGLNEPQWSYRLVTVRLVGV